MADSGRRSLLSRIASGNPSLPDEERSILGHLQSLLNTRQGDAPCVPGYGVIDFADVVHGFPGTILQLSKSIRATILEFEPRLKNVMVRHVPDETLLTLRFEISAQLARAKGNRMLRVNTTVRAGGRVDVA